MPKVDFRHIIELRSPMCDQCVTSDFRINTLVSGRSNLKKKHIKSFHNKVKKYLRGI